MPSHSKTSFAFNSQMLINTVHTKQNKSFTHNSKQANIVTVKITVQAAGEQCKMLSVR